jgi:hypothetical protein
MANRVSGHVDENGRECTRCRQYKSRENFAKSGAYAGFKNGIPSWCKECTNHFGKERRRNDPNVNIRARESHRRTRMAALIAYGGDPPHCACCGEAELKFLAIDHINGGGTAHARELGGSSLIVHWLKRHGYPAGFQVLCHNCNTAKGHYGQCPHQECREMVDETQRKYCQ